MCRKTRETGKKLTTRGGRERRDEYAKRGEVQWTVPEIGLGWEKIAARCLSPWEVPEGQTLCSAFGNGSAEASAGCASYIRRVYFQSVDVDVLLFGVVSFVRWCAKQDSRGSPVPLIPFSLLSWRFGVGWMRVSLSSSSDYRNIFCVFSNACLDEFLTRKWAITDFMISGLEWRRTRCFITLHFW